MVNIVIPPQKERDTEKGPPTHVVRETSKSLGKFLHISSVKYRRIRGAVWFHDLESADLWAAMRARELHCEGVDAKTNMTRELSLNDRRLYYPLTYKRSDASMLEW